MFRLLAASSAISVLVAGCGSYDGSSSFSMARGAAKVEVADSPLGRILVDGEGRTLYLFENDNGAGSTCYDVCASSWPPVTTNAQPTAGSGVVAQHLGTTRREDGKLAVTYAGHPLYRYAGDTKRGDTNGAALSRFGAGWYVVAPSGQKIDRN
ncbi:MAG TPA: hypothetical protein VF066_13785 [Thermoleophilaceae bacterium]